MEYIEGQTPARWMMTTPAPDLDSVRSLAAQIAKGLQPFTARKCCTRPAARKHHD